ncbi:MAG: hypothetical protein RTU30_03815, partial [Candidatus Thorarchaeota archaeon]
MNIFRNRLVLVVLVASVLLIPLASNTVSSNDTIVKDEFDTAQLIAEPDLRVGTIEAIVSAVDPWGGVTNAVGCIQNASHYGYSYVDNLQTVTERQIAEENGAVSSVYLEMNAQTVYPNGVVGPPTAIIYLQVIPIYEAVAEQTQPNIVTLSLDDAYDLAEEIVSVYETALSLDFIKMGTYSMEYYYGFSSYINVYHMAFVATPTAAIGLNAMTTLRMRLSQLGGFMSLLAGSTWPDSISHIVEAYLPAQIPTDYPYYSMFNPIYFYQGMGGPYFARILDPAYMYEVELQAGIAGGIFFYDPDSVTAVTGDESYSIAADVGYSGQIQNKMYEDNSVSSISAIAATTPSYLEMSGIPTDWEVIDDDYDMPPMYVTYLQYFPGGPLSEFIEFMGTAYPSSLLGSYMYPLAYLEPWSFDYTIDSLWGDYPYTPVDLKQYLLDFDYSGYSAYIPVGDINIDLLSDLLSSAGLTPTVLVDYIDPTVAEDDPIEALILAFLAYFDNYNLLDILDDTVYPDPIAVEQELNTAIDGIASIIEDFSGIEVAPDFANKEAIAEFVEDHWDITLQALWTAMASFSNDTTPIKNVAHDILDKTNLMEHILPFLEMDLGTAIADGMGVALAVNYEYNPITYQYHYRPMSGDVELEFDLDLDSSLFSGPFLLVTKDASPRTVALNGDVGFTITVKNLGSASAYNLKLLDGMSPSFDGDREYYWTRNSLAAGQTWTVPYTVSASSAGVYMDIPAICAYFNQSLDTYVSTPTTPTASVVPGPSSSLSNTTYSTYWYTTTVTETWYTTWDTTYTWQPPPPYYPPTIPNYWSGSVFYTMSQPGHLITVGGSGFELWEGTGLVLVVAGGAGVVIVIFVGY